jgi:hypothetical protein
MSTTPTPLTRKDFLKMSPEELKKIVSDPTRLAEANSILDGSTSEVVAPIVPDPVVPDDEAARLAAEAAEVAKAAQIAEAEKAQAEAATVAAKQAEQDAYKAAGVTVETDAAGNILKIVKTYQARDESGNPIGRPTYLEAKSWLELSVKQQNAHEHAVRFGERVKKQVGKVTPKKEDPNAPKPLSEQELLQLQEDLKSEDRDKASKAAEAVRRNDDVKTVADASKAIEDARQAKESYAFLSSHVTDFNRCEANNKMLSDYIRDNQLEWTADNLEAAFLALGSQLTPKEPVQPPAPVIPAPVASAAVVTPPAAAATTAPPTTQIPAPPAPRPGVNAGIVPGENSGSRPVTQPKGLTKQDVKNMSREEYKRRLKDPKFVAEVNALRIRSGL